MAPSRARIILVREMVILADISTPCFERRSVEMIKNYPEPSGSAAGYRGLSLEDLEDAGIRVAERRSGAKDAIFVPGDPDEHLYFVLSGTVRLYKIYGDYKEATVALLKDGDVFGELSLQEGSGQTVFARALTDVRVAVVRKSVLVEFLKRDPELAMKLFSSLFERLKQSEEVVDSLLDREVSARLTKLLQNLGDRFGETNGFATVLDMSLTHQDLANMIASTREAVSKAMGEFQRDGLIEVRNRKIAISPRMARDTLGGSPSIPVAANFYGEVIRDVRVA
jgi:CRP/FNR family transcriptional regulator, global nitrogen regulator